MYSLEQGIQEIAQTLAKMHHTGERILTAIQDLSAAVTALATVTAGVLAHEQQLQQQITALQAAAASAPADQTDAINAAVTGLNASLSQLKGTLPPDTQTAQPQAQPTDQPAAQSAPSA